MPRSVGSRSIRSRPVAATGDPAAARELQLYIDNDYDLYRGQYTSIIKNLLLKHKRGTYDSDKAVRLWEYLTAAGAKKYGQQFGPSGESGTGGFSKATRRLAAVSLRDNFEADMKAGNYD